MTATRDRGSDLDPVGDIAWDERAVLNNAKGWPWWGTVLLAFGLSVVGAIVSQQLAGELGLVFDGAYFVGCVGGICAVQRRSLFGPMVQPPLVLGVTVPLVALFTSGSGLSGGLRNMVLTIATPLINGFPTMAITTAVTVAIGLLRIFYLQRNPEAAAERGRGRREASERNAEQATKRISAKEAERRSRDKRGSARRPERAGGERGSDRGAAARRPAEGRAPREDPRAARDRQGRQGGGQRGATSRGNSRDATARGDSSARERGKQPRPQRDGERRRSTDRDQRGRRDDR